MGNRLFTSTLLQVAGGSFLSLLPDGRDQLTLPNGSTAPLTPEEAAAIESFAVPRTLASGVRAVQRRFPQAGGGDLLGIVTSFIDSGVIRPYGLEPLASAAPRGSGMYGCPSATLEQALAGEVADVVFAGIPYELGVTGRAGARSGPAYLRRCSRVAFDYVERDGIPIGWWDSGRRRRVLEGVRFCDVGDVQCAGTGRNGEAFDKAYEVATALLLAGRVPVMVGGDHSVSLPLITAAAAVHPGLGVLHFDAHADLGSRVDMGEWRKNCTHGNFMSWVVANEKVASITQFGIRHLMPEPPHDSAKVTSHPGRTFVTSVEQIAESLPADRPYYLTFDVDCLDPAVVSQTGTPIPGGLEYREAVHALEALSSRVDIVAMDVVELASSAADGDYREGTTVAYLLFEVLSNVFARRASQRARTRT